VEASSRAGNRRPLRAQTDGLAGPQLRTRLRRAVAGATRGWSRVRVPRMAADDRRPRQRAWATPKRARPRGIHRLNGRRASPGLGRPPRGDCQPPLEARRRWDGAPLPAGRRPRRGQAWEPAPALAQRLGQVAAARRA
jgi:hypothetical protein